MANPISSVLNAGLGIFSDATSLGERTRTAIQNYRELTESAREARVNAVGALQRGGVLAGMMRRRGTNTIGQQKVGFAAAGLDAGYGTPAQLGEAARIFTDLDASTAINDARAEAFGHGKSARRYANAAKQLDREYMSGGFTGQGQGLDTFVTRYLANGLQAASAFGGG